MYGLAWFLGAGSRSSVNLDEGILAKRGQNDLCSHRISQSVRQRELVRLLEIVEAPHIAALSNGVTCSRRLGPARCHDEQLLEVVGNIVES